MKRITDIEAFILAGGSSRRLGMDKAFLNIDGQKFIDLIIDRISSIFESVKIIGRLYSHPHIKDSLPDIIPDMGPMGGIYTALTASGSDLNFITGIDYPFLDIELISFIIKTARDDVSKNYDAFIPVYKNKTHPLISIYRKSTMDNIKTFLINKQTRVNDLLKSLRIKVIKIEEIDDYVSKKDPKIILLNINTAEDYKKYIEYTKKCTKL